MVFPQVFRQHCGWHLITCGWGHHCSAHGRASKNTNKPFYKVCQKVLNWLYSWLDSKVEMENKYIFSKALLFSYVMNPDQMLMLGHVNSEKTIDFIREHVIPYEQNAAFFQRINIQHFECTNSSIEGGFGGMKYSGMPVNPQHSISQLVCILSLSSEIKNTIREQEMAVKLKLPNYGVSIKLAPHVLNLEPV